MKIKGFDQSKLGEGNEEKENKNNQNYEANDRMNNDLEVLKGITEDYRENIPEDEYEPSDM